MDKKAERKNTVTRSLIEELNRAGIKTPAWKAVSKGLKRPGRKSYEVNILRLEKHSKSNDNIVVPGIVLGTGILTKPITVAALRFSDSAKEKITKAGGKALSIEELLKLNPEAKKLRIMG